MADAYATEEAAREGLGRRADAVYEKSVKPHLTAADDGKFVALNVDSGVYEIDADKLAAIHRLRDQYPDARSWLFLVGSRSVDRLGAGSLADDI